MKFLRLDIKNFLTIGDAAPVYLDGKGLVLIQGVNEDDSSATSNGVGKSSIPDALCWAIYGETARGESGDAVVNNTAKKDCFVSVTVQDGDSIYRITRYRKHKEFKNQTVVEAMSATSVSAPVDVSKGTEKETQEVINGIMGCSLDVFQAAIYAGQEEMPDLPKMTDKQLKLLIEEAAGVERLEGAYAKAREKWSGAKTLLDTHLFNKSNLETRLHTNNVAIESKKIEYRAFEEGRKDRAEEFNVNALRIKGQMVGIVADVKKMDEATVRAEFDKLDTQLADHAKVVAGERELSGKVTAAQSTLNRAQATADASLREVNRIKGVIDNAAEEMKKPCPECGKPHTEDELAAYVATQKGNLVAAVNKAKLDKAAVEAAQRIVTDVQTALDTYRKEMPDVSAVTERRRVLNATLTEIAGLKSRLQVLKKDHEACIERANQALTAPNPHTSAVDVLIGQSEELSKKIEGLTESISAAQDKVTLYENVVKVFGPAGVRAHILDSVTPFLNERTADYLSALSDGNISAVWSTLSTTAKGDLKEKFNIEVENEKGAKTFKGLSGGEKRKVRLATMLALQDLVASRASKPIDLWIGDEIDDALDVAGLERLMGVLERKSRERGTVLVVSHNEMRDWIDNVVTVTKKGGYSTIEGALC